MLSGVLLIMNMNELNTVANEELRFVVASVVKNFGDEVEVSKGNMQSVLGGLAADAQNRGHQLEETLTKLFIHTFIEEKFSWKLYCSRTAKVLQHDLRRIQKFFYGTSIKYAEQDYQRLQSLLDDDSLTKTEVLSIMQRTEVLINELSRNHRVSSVGVINQTDKSLDEKFCGNTNKHYSDFDVDHDINPVYAMLLELEARYKKSSRNTEIAELMNRPEITDDQLKKLLEQELSLLKSSIDKDIAIRKEVFEPTSSKHDSELISKAKEVSSVVESLRIKQVSQELVNNGSFVNLDDESCHELKKHEIMCLNHLHGSYIDWALDAYNYISEESSKDHDMMTVLYLIEQIRMYSSLLPYYECADSGTENIIAKLQEISALADLYKKDSISSKQCDMDMAS